MPAGKSPASIGATVSRDILDEARNVAGEDWLHVENSRLGGMTPAAVIAKGPKGEALVRDILDSIRYVGVS